MRNSSTLVSNLFQYALYTLFACGLIEMVVILRFLPSFMN